MGEASWLTLVFIVGGGLGVLVIGWLASRAGKAGAHHRFDPRELVCPNLGRAVSCTFVQDLHTGKRILVARCSAFDDPERVRCGQDCARLVDAGAKLDVVGG